MLGRLPVLGRHLQITVDNNNYHFLDISYVLHVRLEINWIIFHFYIVVTRGISPCRDE